MNTSDLWKHTWPSSEVLCEFIASNSKVWRNATILELGAGVAALPSLTVLKCGATKAWITDQSHLSDVFVYLHKNIERNFGEMAVSSGQVHLMGLDWNDDESIKSFLNQTNKLDFIFGSDVFFDPHVFPALIGLLRKLFDTFPKAEFYFAYQIRDSDWSIEELLILNRLLCVPIRLVNTDKHSIYLGKIIVNYLPEKRSLSMSSSIISTNSSNPNEDFSVFAGIEGGGTQSSLILITSAGVKLGEWKGASLNCLLKGSEATADYICEWIRAIVAEYRFKNPHSNLHLPLSGLGMGLAGAEDTEVNNKMVEYLIKYHADISNHFYLTADSVIAIASCFPKGGVVLIAGTGSTCRLLKADESIHSVGGWGHLIGDGGSGFWIAIQAIRNIFNAEDELIDLKLDFRPAKTAFLEHFKIQNKLQIFDLLYGERFEKAKIASFCTKLSKLAMNGDSFSVKMFEDAGSSLAQHFCAVSRHFDDEMFKNVSLLTVGSVFQSWSLLRNGFDDYVRKFASRKPILKISLYQLTGTAAVGAVFLAAKTLPGFSGKQTEKLFDALHSRIFLDELSFTN